MCCLLTQLVGSASQSGAGPPSVRKEPQLSFQELRGTGPSNLSAHRHRARREGEAGALSFCEIILGDYPHKGFWGTGYRNIPPGGRFSTPRTGSGVSARPPRTSASR